MLSFPIALQTRDLILLSGLFECRIMTAEHIASLYFNGSREAAKKRLQKLKAAGLIGERNRLVNEPSILFLTRKASALLKAHGRLSTYPPLSVTNFENRASVGELAIKHELEIMDVKTAFHAVLAKSEGCSLA